MSTCALTLVFLLALAPFTAFGGPGEGGGPRPTGGQQASELMPEQPPFDPEIDHQHPRDERDSGAERDVLER